LYSNARSTIGNNGDILARGPQGRVVTGRGRSIRHRTDPDPEELTGASLDRRDINRITGGFQFAFNAKLPSCTTQGPLATGFGRLPVALGSTGTGSGSTAAGGLAAGAGAGAMGVELAADAGAAFGGASAEPASGARAGASSRMSTVTERRGAPPSTVPAAGAGVTLPRSNSGTISTISRTRMAAPTRRCLSVESKRRIIGQASRAPDPPYERIRRRSVRRPVATTGASARKPPRRSAIHPARSAWMAIEPAAALR
jgi:hypothetical protein